MVGEMRICHCGVQVGYSHKEHCPFPLYHDGDRAIARWEFGSKLSRREEMVFSDMFTGGIHRGSTIAEVLEDDPGYLEWACDEMEGFCLSEEVTRAMESALYGDDPLEDI